ncbi:Endonuclease/exonuclease/phosphatase, partial [Earliella scabrosa]
RKRTTKGRIKIATLNMRGYGAQGARDIDDKWMRLNQVMRENRIAILALQETHLTEERVLRLNELFNATLFVIASLDDENQRGARGVAFAVNKRLMSTEGLTIREVVPGRAVSLGVPWSADRPLHIMNVYAPNASAENDAFWKTLKAKVVAGQHPRPDVIVGDFNVVEEALDRLPPRKDAEAAVQSLQDMLRTFKMCDVWRRRNEGVRAYTYLQTSTGSQSRIDRTYLAEGLAKGAEHLDIVGPGVQTDHRMATFSLAKHRAPHMGGGRWAFTTALLDDPEYRKTLEGLTRKLQSDIAALRDRTEDLNAQRLYADYKKTLARSAKDRARKLMPKLDRQICDLKRSLERALGEREPDVTTVGVLQDDLAKLEVRRFGNIRRAVAANDWAKGEKLTTYWTGLNAPR